MRRFAMPSTRERWHGPLEVSELNVEAGTFRGYAAVFNNLVQSWIPTIIMPGAFATTLQDRPLSEIKILWQHNMDDPIGLPTSLVETAIGLEIAAKITPTAQTQHYMALLKDKVVDALSIGFDPIKWSLEDRGPDVPPLRKIQELKLWEVSLVTWPADDKARILEVNAMVGFEELPGYAADVQLVLIGQVLARQAALELQAGKVLSAKNKGLVEQAITALQALLSAAMKEEERENEEDGEEQGLAAARLIQLAEAELAYAEWLATHRAS